MLGGRPGSASFARRRRGRCRVRNRTKRKAVISSYDKSSNQGDAKVRQASFHQLIRRALRDHYAAVMAEPIPRQWLDMLNRLPEEEPKKPPSPARARTRRLHVMDSTS